MGIALGEFWTKIRLSKIFLLCFLLFGTFFEKNSLFWIDYLIFREFLKLNRCLGGITFKKNRFTRKKHIMI